MSAISCREVTHRFGALTAVDTVSLEVENNEVFGVISPQRRGQDHAPELPRGPAQPHVRDH